MSIQIPHELTNPKRILFVMANQNGVLTTSNAAKLVQCGVFKDKKAFSNAMYILTRDGYALKDPVLNEWLITRDGVAYLGMHGAKHHAKSDDEILKAEITKLEDENAKLCQEIESLKHMVEVHRDACKAWVDACERKSQEVKSWIDACNAKDEEISELEAKLHRPSNDVNPSYDDIINAGTKVINDILTYLNK